MPHQAWLTPQERAACGPCGSGRRGVLCGYLCLSWPLEASRESGNVQRLIERDVISDLADPERPGEAHRLDPDSVEDAHCADLIGRVRAAGAWLELWHLPGRFGVAVMACYLWREDLSAFLVSGSGAHLDPHVALSRALTKAAQSRLTQITGSREDTPPAVYRPGPHRGPAATGPGPEMRSRGLSSSGCRNTPVNWGARWSSRSARTGRSRRAGRSCPGNGPHTSSSWSRATAAKPPAGSSVSTSGRARSGVTGTAHAARAADRCLRHGRRRWSAARRGICARTSASTSPTGCGRRPRSGR
ncbi:YcaO-like family protein (plasmid) [Streptomyces sp. YIM 121038]|nr:YcaO-like family protein [Streptomyces sp. YIM 121038]